MSSAGPAHPRLSPLAMLGKSSRLTLGTQLGAVLNFAATLIAARALGPEQLGAVALVSLALLYASYLRLGITEGGERELIDRLGRDERAEAERIQRIAFTADLLWSLLPAAGLLAMSLVFDEPVRQVGFLLAPLMYLGTALYRMLMRLHLAHQRVDLVAPINAVRAIGQPLLLLALLPALGPFSLLVAPLIVEWLLVGVYLLRTPLNLRPALHWGEVPQLIKIGLPLSLMALVYWSYRLVGPSSVAAALPVRELGLYNFANGPINLLLVAFAEFSAVLTPALWGELSRSGSARRLRHECVRITLFITLAACVMANLAQAGFRPFVLLVAPTFAPATPAFDLLAFNLVLLTVTFVPGLILDSSVVNRQWQHLGVWVVGLLVNLGANALAIRLGGGILAIAANDIWVQLLVAVAVFALAQRFIFEQMGEALSLYWRLGALLALSAATYTLLRLLPITEGAHWGEIIGATALRVGLVAAVWVAPAFVLLRMAPPHQWGTPVER